MGKGSYASRPLQDIAVRIALRCARLRTENCFLHVSVETLVAEGIDDRRTRPVGWRGRWSSRLARS